MDGASAERTLLGAGNLASTLRQLNKWVEAKTFLREQVAIATQAWGESHGMTMKLNAHLSDTLRLDPAATRDDLRL